MDYTGIEDIYDFYRQSGMNRQEAFVFLLKELNKNKTTGGNHEEESRRNQKKR